MYHGLRLHLAAVQLARVEWKEESQRASKLYEGRRPIFCTRRKKFHSGLEKIVAWPIAESVHGALEFNLPIAIANRQVGHSLMMSTAVNRTPIQSPIGNISLQMSASPVKTSIMSLTYQRLHIKSYDLHSVSNALRGFCLRRVRHFERWKDPRRRPRVADHQSLADLRMLTVALGMRRHFAYESVTGYWHNFRGHIIHISD